MQVSTHNGAGISASTELTLDYGVYDLTLPTTRDGGSSRGQQTLANYMPAKRNAPVDDVATEAVGLPAKAKAKTSQAAGPPAKAKGKSGEVASPPPEIKAGEVAGPPAKATSAGLPAKAKADEVAALPAKAKAGGVAPPPAKAKAGEATGPPNAKAVEDLSLFELANSGAALPGVKKRGRTKAESAPAAKPSQEVPAASPPLADQKNQQTASASSGSNKVQVFDALVTDGQRDTAAAVEPSQEDPSVSQKLAQPEKSSSQQQEEEPPFTESQRQEIEGAELTAAGTHRDHRPKTQISCHVRMLFFCCFA